MEISEALNYLSNYVVKRRSEPHLFIFDRPEITESIEVLIDHVLTENEYTAKIHIFDLFTETLINDVIIDRYVLPNINEVLIDQFLDLLRARNETEFSAEDLAEYRAVLIKNFIG